MKRHNADWTSLIFGAAFLAIASLTLAKDSLDFRINEAWLIPFFAAVVGIAILTGGRRKALPETVGEELADAVETDIMG
jgi:hypothetical protein